MGMFDTYVPQGELVCPVCQIALRNWQGKDGDAALFIWRQGVAAPIGQDAGSWSIAATKREQLRLPASFGIYSGDCRRHFVSARCRCDGDVWTETTVIGAESLPPTALSHEPYA